MPDKSQNITINYKFNTQDVAGATAILNRANQASNNLQQSAQKAGSSISQEFQKSNKTILDMQTALTRLKSVIEVTSNPQKLKQLSAEYQQIKRQLDAATKSAYGFNDAVKKQSTGITQLSSQFGNLYRAAQTVFGAAIVRQVVNTTLEMARLSGQTEGVERAFNRAFGASTAILMQLRQATRGTVTDFELMQRTLQATNLGLSVQALPQLFEFAAARAQQTGESVDYLVDSIVRGIGRKSVLILDNLGISAVRLKEAFGGASLASQSVGDVTEAVGKIAQEELTKMGGLAETSATKVDKLTTSWEKLRTTVSKRMTGEGGVVDFFTRQINNIEELFRGSSNALIDRAQESGAADALRVLQSQQFKDLQDNEQAKTDFIQQEVNSRVEIERKYAVQIADMSAELIKIRKNDVLLPNEIARIKFLETQIQSQKLAVISMQEARRTLKAFLDDLTKPQEAAESSGIIERKRKEIEALQEQIEKTNKLSDLGVGGRLTSQLEVAQAELADLLRAFSDIKLDEFKLEINSAAQTLSNFGEVAARIDNQLRNFKAPTPQQAPQFVPTNWDKLKDDFEENWRDITSAGIDIQADQLKSMAEVELESYRMRLDALKEFYNEQMFLAGDNEKAKDELRRKEQRESARLRNDMARKEKQVRRSQVYIDMAAGIAKAFATYPWPYALIPAAFVAAQGAAQLAIINRQPTNFAKGVINVGRQGGKIGLTGPGTETSDSIPANLSRGESVMTAWETRVAGDVLREIRAKKLDNRELKRLRDGRVAVTSQRFDDKQIIAAIKSQKHPDVVKTANIVYESHEYTNGYKKKVRASSMGI